MDVFQYNRDAWNHQVRQGDRWTVPVSSDVIARARTGAFFVVLTPRKPVPRSWFPDPLEGTRILCLAAGGGQQGPLLAAAGARVTVFDASPGQLGQDRLVAEREGLSIELVEGDMRDLSCFNDGQFDLIFHPVSNCFVDAVKPVWRECYRVLRRGGHLLAGFTMPIAFCFDPALEDRGILQIKYSLPYSDTESLSDVERRRYTDKNDPLCFAHSLDEQIEGQLELGFAMVGFYEDLHTEGAPASKYNLPMFMATRVVKL